MLAVAIFIVLASIALFIPMFLMMFLRTKLTGNIVRTPYEFISQHGLSVIELFLSNFLIARYVLKPAFSQNNYFWEFAHYYADYCVLSILVCVFLLCCELSLRKCIAKYSPNIMECLLSAKRRTSAKISAADEIVYKKTKCHLDELFAIAFIIITFCFMLNRAFYGTEKTDEAYYYADALSVLQGNLPYAYNNSSTVGMSLLMIIPMAIYRLIHQDMAGIFLYMRICFLIFKYSIIGAVYLLLKKSLDRRKLLWLIAILIPYLGAIHQSFSYNSVGKYMIFLAGIIIATYLGHKHESDRKTGIMLFLAGFLAAIGVFAHPLQGAGAFLLALLILFYKKGSLTEKLKSFLMYVTGGISEILVVFIPVCIQAGTGATLSGAGELLFQRSSMEKGPTFSQRCIEFFNIYGTSLKILTVTFIVTIAVLFIYQIIKKNQWKFRDQILFSGSVSFLVLCLYLSKAFISTRIGGLLIWLVILFVFVRKEKLFVFLSLPCIAFFIAELMMVPNGGVAMRSIYLYPILFGWLYTAFKSKHVSVTVIGCFISLLMSITLIRSNYETVYRDYPFHMLTYQVPKGIYKGIYTTEQNAHDLIELEEYIKANTSPVEKIQFRDNTPAAYLMHTSGAVSDIRTWDCMQFTYRHAFNTNNPQNMYKYYKRTNSIPDKIIYVDFGRDARLSIEEPGWKYNKFVNAYYSKQSEVRLNKTFRVMIYINNGKFNGDYDSWIQSATK